MIIAFPAAPQIDPEAVRKDEELNKLLARRVEEIIMENTPVISLNAVVALLMLEDFTDMPPGAGIYSKTCIIDAYKKAV